MILPAPDTDIQDPEVPDIPMAGPAIVVPDTAPPSSAPVEPLMGLHDFAAWRQLAPPVLAALKRWMALRGYVISGHYPPAQWQAYYTEMLTT